MANYDKCPLCDWEDNLEQGNVGGRPGIAWIRCPRCGQFNFSKQLEIDRDIKEEFLKVRHLCSGLSRRRAELDQDPPEFLHMSLEETLKDPSIPDDADVRRKANLLLDVLRERSTFFGERVRLKLYMDYPLVFARNAEEMAALVQLLKDRGLIKPEFLQMPDGKREANITVTASGWEVTDPTSKEREASKQGFIAIWFDDSMNDSIEAAEEAIAESGFSPMCIKDKHFKERIMDKALGEIQKSKFIVIDLTGQRPSVFFEAGFAHGLDIEAIYVYRKAEADTDVDIEFYAKHYQCHAYEDATDLKQILIDAIAARVR